MCVHREGQGINNRGCSPACLRQSQHPALRNQLGHPNLSPAWLVACCPAQYQPS